MQQGYYYPEVGGFLGVHMSPQTNRAGVLRQRPSVPALAALYEHVGVLVGGEEIRILHHKEITQQPEGINLCP
jgi:hypothetical protein